MGYNDDSNSKRKKLSIIVISSIVLVGMVGSIAYTTMHKSEQQNDAPQNGQVYSSNKAVQSVCAPTQYKNTCEESLASANTADPKELIKIAFQYAEKAIGDVISKSATIQEAGNDPRTKGALDVCKVVLNDAIEDFKRSSTKVGAEFDLTKMESYLDDLKTWLSGTVTYQETCIDAFENTTGNAGDKMKALLKTTSELASNSIAMVSGLTNIVSQLSFTKSTRRLLLQKSDEIPSFVSDEARRILFAQGTSLAPNAIVSADGKGQFKTITEAVNSIPKGNNQTFVIFVRAGVYNEQVEIPKKVNKVVLIGEGPTKTKITGRKNAADGTRPFNTATVAVNADYFLARDIGFENTAGPQGHQAVALRVSGDYAVVYNCQIDGYQDTLYVHTYRQFYRDCTISGTIDFVYGDAAAIFQNCKFIVRKPMDNQNCMVTAQGRKDPLSVGVIVLQKCQILAEPALLAAIPGTTKSYLGRPWKEFSRTIIMNTAIDGFIDPEGWSEWMGTFGLDTLYYGEYQNTGLGANIAKRVTWKGIQKITPQIAESFTPGKYFKDDTFITTYRIPYVPGMMT